MKIEHNHEHHEKATGNLIFVFILECSPKLIFDFSSNNFLA